MSESNDNPYASPLAEEAPRPSVGERKVEGWRDGRYVVVCPGTQLPDRCIFCNSEAMSYRERKRNLWISLSGVARLNYRYWLCPKHALRQRLRPIIGFCLVPILILLFGFAFEIAEATQSNLIVILALVSPWIFAVIAYMTLGLWAGGPFKVRRTDGGNVWIDGAGDAFLGSLPEWSYH